MRGYSSLAAVLGMLCSRVAPLKGSGLPFDCAVVPLRKDLLMLLQSAHGSLKPMDQCGRVSLEGAYDLINACLYCRPSQKTDRADTTTLDHSPHPPPLPRRQPQQQPTPPPAYRSRHPLRCPPRPQPPQPPPCGRAPPRSGGQLPPRPP